ncbi:hypothetical protein BEP19_01365 [Ammoniphilus oxalaticus]|uniref:Uncharacterized protein n=1 Tax=Ammoniphilus oxalaticus TaxID=66863 RepID=A0A419SMU2_9BACL|nr:ABC-2 transporter permease [Ammoniphilus oxalaticus]RKD25620.1 hypothetical protein BEP19_01365 [Ammoniphilus oxalaticus]
MLNVMGLEMRMIKPWEYLIFLPAVFFFAFVVNRDLIHPFYMSVFFFAWGITSFSTLNTKHEATRKLVLSLPITKREYIGAKYLLAIVWFLISTVVTTFFLLPLAFFIGLSIDFFSLELWIAMFLLYLMLNSVYIPLALFIRSIGWIVPLALAAFITAGPDVFSMPKIAFYPTLLVAPLLFSLSYYGSVKIMEGKDVT